MAQLHQIISKKEIEIDSLHLKGTTNDIMIA